MTDSKIKKRVVYLLGAGASHACVDYAGGGTGILMRDLNPKLSAEVSKLVRSKNRQYQALHDLTNDVIDEDTDFEHVITFLDESPSKVHRQFAEDLRKIFQKVLFQELTKIKKDLGKARFLLYSALLDMYQIEDCPESLHAILSLNYDEYIEGAAKEVCKCPIDFGVHALQDKTSKKSLRLIKLHGSFTWKDIWPIGKQVGNGKKNLLWIPPGIQKSKERYPFSALWSMAREALDCDVVRIIGCRLSPSDWDLISLLFTTRHTHVSNKPYLVEVIDSPLHAFELSERYPYLDVRSILEIETMDIGCQLVAEFSDGIPRKFQGLSDEAKNTLRLKIGTNKNWFQIWLEQMAEAFNTQLNDIETPTGMFRKLLERKG